MTLEDRLRSVRLEADAGPLRSSVLAAAARATREQRLWRWTWAAAAVVVAVAIPINQALSRRPRPLRSDPVLALPRPVNEDEFKIRIRLSMLSKPAVIRREEIHDE
jgi:hypothetical protein